MIKLLISPEAENDLRQIGDYIAFELKNRSAARRVIQGIRETVKRLQAFPERGVPVKPMISGVRYRYIQSGNYLIFYEFSENTVYIDRVLYAHRDYLSILFGPAFSDPNETS